MTTIVKGGYSGKEAFYVKIIDTIVSDTHYLKDAFQSRDQMKTWKLTYKISMKKVE
jgi:hypothetical protein